MELLRKCSVCRSLIDEEDLFCANCGTEAPVSSPDRSQEAPRGRTTTHNFECAGCGASMSFDASAGSLRCPFCDSVELVAQRDAKTLRPRRVVRFSVDSASAVAAMRRWLGRGFWRPSDLARRARVAAMTAVYVPYWVFRAKTKTYWTADTDRTPPGARGDWFPLFGETAALSPFNLRKGVDPQKADLDNVTVETFAVGRKYARRQARFGIESLEASRCEKKYVPGRCRNMKVNVRIEGMASRPVLLPVWIMAYRYRGEVFRLLVNGQSGKATGGAPISTLKVVLACILGLALLVVVVAVIAAASD